MEAISGRWLEAYLVGLVVLELVVLGLAEQTANCDEYFIQFAANNIPTPPREPLFPAPPRTGPCRSTSAEASTSEPPSTPSEASTFASTSTFATSSELPEIPISAMTNTLVLQSVSTVNQVLNHTKALLTRKTIVKEML